MTHDEIISVVKHHRDGGEVEYQEPGDDEWHGMTDPIDHMDFSCFDYRIKPTKQKRLLTVKELWGKTLMHPQGSMFMVTDLREDGRIALIPHEDESESASISIEIAHAKCWKLAGPDLCYETATSLEVEE